MATNAPVLDAIPREENVIYNYIDKIHQSKELNGLSANVVRFLRMKVSWHWYIMILYLIHDKRVYSAMSRLLNRQYENSTGYQARCSGYINFDSGVQWVCNMQHFWELILFITLGRTNNVSNRFHYHIWKQWAGM